MTYQVINPSIFPILADSSNAGGTPTLDISRDRHNRDNGVYFAMRYNRRGLIFTLDGSAQMIGEAQLNTYGFQTGYVFNPSNPVTNPERLVTVN